MNNAAAKKGYTRYTDIIQHKKSIEQRWYSNFINKSIQPQGINAGK